jgi:hypothetical protein
MKKYILYLFLFITTFINAQTVTDNFAGWANVVSVNGNTVVITQFFGNPTKFGDTFILSDMQVGDILWTSSCSRFIITAKSGGTLTISDPDPGLSIAPFPGERVGFTREEDVNGFLVGSIPQSGDGNAGAISGVSITSGACILSHYINNVKSAIKNNTIKNEAISTSTVYTVIPNNIEVDASAGDVTITLPTLPLLPASDKEVFIYRKASDASSNAITVISGGTTIGTFYNQIGEKITCTNGVWSLGF